MEPTRKDIADLFSVILEGDPNIEALPRKSKGANADESMDLGSQSLNEGNYEKAIEHFQRAIEQRGDKDVSGRIGLGGAYEYAEMEPEALREYHRALRIRKDSPEVLIGLSQLYKRHARYKDSLKQIEEALTLEPRNAFFQFKAAEILREVGDKERALLAARLAAAAAPDDSFYHYWVGDLLIEMGRFNEALDSLKTALDLSPGDDFLYLRAASAFWGAGRKQESIKSVRLASDLDPDKHLYHGVLELLLDRTGLEEEAKLEAQRASKMDSYDRDALDRFAGELSL
jgi:tetratricopeptide (TPR) repeat protein